MTTQTTRPAIHTDAEHQAALDRIEQIWGGEAGTPEGNELEDLGRIVSAYEDQRWPI
jgi:HTH-type transcriptional regulator / antitoxin HigA